MSVFSKRCGCGQVFQLASLMSREQNCTTCARAKATVVMAARKQETAPVARTTVARGITVPAGALDRDACAVGVAKPVAKTWDAAGFARFLEQQPAPVAKADERRWFAWAAGSTRSHVSLAGDEVFEALSSGRFGDELGAWILNKGDRVRLVAGLVDIVRKSRAAAPMRDPMPAPPKTLDEALALLKQGWWLGVDEAGSRAVTVRNEDGHVEHATHYSGGMWVPCGDHCWSDRFLLEGRYQPIRPEHEAKS